MMRKYLGWGLAVLAVLVLVAATTNPGYFNSLIVAGGLFTVEDDGTVTADLGSASTVDDAALSAYVAHLNAAETITANWVNTANPWADNEVSDSITIGSGGNLAAPPAIGGTTPNTGAFTTLTTSGAVGLGIASPLRMLHFSNNACEFLLTDADYSENQKTWRLRNASGNLYVDSANDAVTSATAILSLVRASGSVIASGPLSASTLTATGSATAASLVTSAASPYLDIYETDAAADAKRVRFHSESGVFHMAFWDDAGANSNSFLTAQRSGITVSAITAAGPFSTSSTHDIEAGGDLVFGGHLRDESATGPTLTEKQTNVVAGTYSGSRDTRGTVNVQATGGDIAVGKICRVTFNTAFSGIPYVVLQATDVTTNDTNLYTLGVDAVSTSGFDIHTGTIIGEDSTSAITWIAIE